jgi:hypothetical protein
MEALSWALTAAAVLLVLYALRVVTQDRDPEKPGSKAGLGCGFFFLACLLWSLAAHDWVGGWLNAFRLGLGVFVATPAIGALTKPHGARLFLGVIGLVLGIVLAGPVIKDLVVEVQQAKTVGLQEELDELRGKELTLAARVAEWEAEILALEGMLQAGGYADVAALQTDPAGMANFENLMQNEELIDLGNERLTLLRAAISQVEARISTQGKDAEADELADLLGLDAAAPTEADLSPVEEYAQQKLLEARFLELGQ